MTDDRPDVKVSRYWVQVCETGRHAPPHPGDTCEEIDQWIAVRDRYLEDLFARSFARFEQASHNAQLAGTVFAAAIDTPIEPWPDGNPVRRALDILAPDLAWQPNYRP
ncbi:hypothetical protein [Streptomyces sp. NPDC058202]|uniref:hypothetical protein n=1 Tax=Streptomyces sp. NPDC058202 TaxID=3346380 RepID=UPI0036EA674F